MKRDFKTDVLIVGAGPVGLFAANLLAVGGVDVMIVDQAEKPAAESCACGLHSASLALLDRIGVAEQLIDLGRRIDRVAFYHGSERLACTDVAEPGNDIPFALGIPQSVLEEVLAGRFQTNEGNRVLWNHKLVGLESANDVETAKVARIGTSSRGYGVAHNERIVTDELTIKARLILGTDGRDSSVRRMSGIDFEWFDSERRFVVFDVEGAAGLDGETRVVLGEGPIAAAWPIGDLKTRWILEAEPAVETHRFPSKERNALVVEHDNLDTAQMERAIRERAPWFVAAVDEISIPTEVPFRLGLAKTFGQGRRWIAGDAAHAGEPIGMQSMNAGLADVAAFADALGEGSITDSQDRLRSKFARHRRLEWQSLIELGQLLHPTPDVDPALVGQWQRVPFCLPALGRDLSHLIRHLGQQAAHA